MFQVAHGWVFRCVNFSWCHDLIANNIPCNHTPLLSWIHIRFTTTTSNIIRVCDGLFRPPCSLDPTIRYKTIRGKTKNHLTTPHRRRHERWFKGPASNETRFEEKIWRKKCGVYRIKRSNEIVTDYALSWSSLSEKPQTLFTQRSNSNVSVSPSP